MKKVTAIVLAAAMGLSLTACGSSANQAGDNGCGGAAGTTQAADQGTAQDSNEAHLVFAWWGNQTRNERTQTALEAYSEQNQGVTFDSQFSDWGDYWNKLATASAGHNLPDYWMSAMWMRGFWNRERLMASCMLSCACLTGLGVANRSNQRFLYKTLASFLSYSAKELRDSLKGIEAISFNTATDMVVQEQLALLKDEPGNMIVKSNAFRQLNTSLLNYYAQQSSINFISLTSETLHVETDSARAGRISEDYRRKMNMAAAAADGRVVWMYDPAIEGSLSAVRSVKRISPYWLDDLGVVTNIFMNISQRQANGYMTFQILEQLNKVSSGNQADEIRRTALEQLLPILTEGVAIHTGKEFIDKTIGYVHQNLSDPELSLKKIAETELFMNVGYLSRQFQKYVGCKFSAFLAQTRIEEAKRIMATDPNATVQDVAVAVGCGNNPQYFSLLFKKHTGCKAIDYIKMMRSKN